MACVNMLPDSESFSPWFFPLKPFMKIGNVEGKYANYFAVGYNSCEFVIDFGQLYLNHEEAELSVRIITSPEHVKILQEVLAESIQEYKENYQPDKTDRKSSGKKR